MPERRLSNARVQGWLADDLERIADQMGSPKALVNSAAIWWFCLNLTAEEQAKILGEFVTTTALRGKAAPTDNGKPRSRRPRQPRKSS